MTPSPMVESRVTAPPDLTALAGVKLGNYRLERLIGRGRMGVVYLAKDEALLRATAIKVLSWSVGEARGQDPVQWFLAEARLVARIDHPRVVQVYGAARQGDLCYIAMEYVPGRSAEAMVARGEPMAPELATDVLVQAASALHAAHRSGVVHRDVKPANLLVREDGVTKLGDFGMALGPAEVRIGNAHLRVGTPYYTAPEIWRGEAASPLSDVYSLGATYFHLLTGRPPFPALEIAAVEQAHLRAPVPDPRELAPSVPASCAALVKRALAKSPRDRHASVQELAWEARRVVEDLARSRGPRRAASPAPPPPPEAPPPPVPPGPLAALGFARAPFSSADAASPASLPPPLAQARARILEWLEDESPVLAVGGPDGCGAGPLLQGLAAALRPSRLVLHVEAGGGADGRPIPNRLCTAAGTEGAPDELEALVERLAGERRAGRPAALVVVDGVVPGHPSATGLAGIVAAALWTRAFKLALGGGPGLPAALGRTGVDFRGEKVPEVAVPPLDREQVAAHLRAGLDATLAPGAPPIIVTPDALLLVALRSQGAIERVDCIAWNMLVLAAADGRRALSSWHAWTAPDRERWTDARAASLPRRPAAWPPPEVADVLDAVRRAAGMPPWPRSTPERI